MAQKGYDRNRPYVKICIPISNGPFVFPLEMGHFEAYHDITWSKSVEKFQNGPFQTGRLN